MSEPVFLEGSRDVSVALDGSWGEGEVRLRESVGGGADSITGDVSIEGTWVHVKSDAVNVTLPQWRVASIDWTGEGRRWP